MLERNYKKIIVFLICFVLFLIPQLFWGNLYQVGGDDTRLYYLFPWEFLKNFDFTIISDNALGTGGGYGSVSYFVPVTFVFFIAKILIPFINIQFFFYGINLACGFLFFYLFLGLWIREESKIVYWFRIVCSLLYIFSPYIINTLYKNQLLAIYLISVVPCTMYLFVKALQEKRWTLILLASLVYSVFSTTILTVPWFYGFLFSQIPLCIYLWFKYKKRFLVYCLLFGVSVFILNFYWLIHFILGIFLAFHSTSLYSQVSTNSSIVSNDSTIQGLSHMNSPVNQLVGYITAGWNVNSKNIFFYVSNIGFMLVILWAGIKKRQVGKSLQKVFLIFLTKLLYTSFERGFRKL